MSAYCGIGFILIELITITSAVIPLTSEITLLTIFIFCYCITMAILAWYYFIIKRNTIMYTWYEFRKDSVVVKNLFKKSDTVYFKELPIVGIAYYIHGIMGSSVGSRHCYIYMTNQRIDNKYKDHINLLVSSKTFLKIGFNQKTYAYLMEHLSNSQKLSLSADAKRLGLIK